MTLKLLAKDFFFNSQQPLKIEPRAPQPLFPEHTHDFHEFVIITGGKGRHIINGKPTILSEKTVLYIHASDFHEFDQVDDLYLTNILIKNFNDFKYLSNLSDLLPEANHHKQWEINKKANTEIQRLLNKIEISAISENHVEMELIFFQLLVLLNQNCFSNHVPIESQDLKVKQILHWLQKNSSENISWSQLADHFSISLRTLQRKIKEQTGITPQQYLLKTRLFEAYHQILYSSNSITSIAIECGFNDSAYFSTCFKEEFGFSPTEIRRKQNA